MDFRDLVFRNFRRKVFALLLAILIWVTIRLADDNNQRPLAGPQWPTNALNLEP
jgi:hypothetical protein